MWAADAFRDRVMKAALHLLPRADVLQQACEGSKLLGSGHFSAVWAVQVDGAKFAMKVCCVFGLFHFILISQALYCFSAYMQCFLTDR